MKTFIRSCQAGRHHHFPLLNVTSQAIHLSWKSQLCTAFWWRAVCHLVDDRAKPQTRMHWPIKAQPKRFNCIPTKIPIKTWLIIGTNPKNLRKTTDKNEIPYLAIILNCTIKVESNVSLKTISFFYHNCVYLCFLQCNTILKSKCFTFIGGYSSDIIRFTVCWFCC